MKNATISSICFLLLVTLFGAGLLAAQSSAQGKSSKTSKTSDTKPQSSAPASQSATTDAGNAPAATNTQPQAFPDLKSKASYAIGLNIGKSMRMQSVDVDPNILVQGLKDGLGGAKALMTDDEVRAAMMDLQADVRAKRKQQNDAFLATNKTKEGVQTLPSGLQYKVITQGTGPKPAASDTVSCNYRGTLVDGTEFDSSSKHGGPVSFPVSGVIKGWTEALQLMPTGSKWQLFIPADLAYGDQPPPGANIPPGATLIFDIELVSIQAK
jgi:FKBP-type peptidyl-prolyl cis-trans isomerase